MALILVTRIASAGCARIARHAQAEWIQRRQQSRTGLDASGPIASHLRTITPTQRPHVVAADERMRSTN